MIEKVLEEKEKVERFLEMARREWCGTSSDYAEQSGVSEATLCNKLAVSRRGGIPVKYDRVKGCYSLERPVEELHSIRVRFLDDGTEYELRDRWEGGI